MLIQPGKEERASIDLMIRLAYVTYAGYYNLEGIGIRHAIRKIAKKVTPEEKIVWGPAVGGNLLDLFSTTVAMITKNTVAEAEGKAVYTLAFRGTNPTSWSSILVQDMDVSNMVPWTLVSPQAKVADDADPAILAGASFTMKDVNKLKYKGKTIPEFLKGVAQEEDAHINVAGHSLGGLTAMMYPIWLMDEFRAAGISLDQRFSLWATGGLSPGNSDFVDYSEKLFADHGIYNLRITNPLDLAPKLWVQAEIANVATMYGPSVDVGKFDRSFIKLLYNMALNRDYTQTPRYMEISASLAEDIDGWFMQFVYQHMVGYINYLEDPAARSALLRMLGMEMMKVNPVMLTKMMIKMPESQLHTALSWRPFAN